MAVEGNFQTAIAAYVDSLTAAEKLNINYAIYEAAFGVSEIADSHIVMPGVRDGSFIPIIKAGNHYNKMVGNDLKSCDLPPCDISLNYSNHKWSLGEYACRLSLCLRDVEEQFLVFWNDFRQTLDDPTIGWESGVGYLGLLMQEIQKSIKGTSWRVSYFGDKASADGYINKNDGFLVQALAGGGDKIDITMAGASATGEEIYEAMKEAYTLLAMKPWATNTDLAWRMPYHTALKLVTMLNTALDASIYNCQCINPNAIVGSRFFTVQGLTIFGIPVKTDIAITQAAQETDDFAGKDWAVLVSDSNWLIGVNEVEKMEEFDIFFDKKDRKVYIDMMVRIGAGVPLDEYILIGQDVEEEEEEEVEP